MRTILSFFFMLLPAAAALPGCGGSDSGASSDVTVVASTTHAADLARNVASDRAAVVGVLAPSADPHEYEPRPSDAEAIAGADLVVESGGDIDLWLDQLVDSSGSDAPVVTLLDSARTIEGEAHEHGEVEDEHPGDEEEHAEDEAVDPHWWQDPANAVAAAEAIRDAMVEVDPEGAEEYESNTASYVERLERLDAAIERCIDRVPEARRKLVTSHDSLGYFAERYGVEVIGSTIPALTTQAQPSAGDTAELVDLIKAEDARAVFPEAGVDTRLERAIADEAGAMVGGELWADALGPDGSGGETYLEAMAANASTIVEGLTDGAESCEIDLE